MRLAQVVVDYDTLARAIGLPTGNRVVSIVPQDAQHVANGIVSVIVEGDDMPKHYDGTHPIVMKLPVVFQQE